MSGAGTFTVVNDKTLCEAIEATEQSLVYVAPGVTKPVVDAIGASLRSKGRRSGSWIGPQERPAFLKKQSALVSAAWSAIAAVPHQHRALHGLAELRRRLLTAGLLESDLPPVRGLNQEDHALPEIKA